MKRIAFIAAGAAAFCLGVVTAPLPGGSEARAAELVSDNRFGPSDSGNGDSVPSSVSADGTKVVFTSRASDLVPNDTNGTFDIFVRDLSARTTTLVSVNRFGTDSGNGETRISTISADGTKVAFASRASDLVTNDTNGVIDVFVRDLTTGTTTLVSANREGTDSGNEDSTSPVISADGTRVVFSSFASDLSFAGGLGPEDTNGVSDIYVRDLITEKTALVTVNDSGTDSGSIGTSGRLAISADGTRVLFASFANDLVPNDDNGFEDVYVRDLTTGTTVLVSVNGSGTESGNGFSSFPVFSAGGTRVAFSSDATDLVPDDANGTDDVFVRDLATGTTALVSINMAGTGSGNGRSGGRFPPALALAISADGTRVVFSSWASDLVPTDTNNIVDLFVRDLSTRTTALVSANDSGTDGGNGGASFPVISADGTRVAFESHSSDLGPGDTNGTADVYLRDLTTGTTTLMSVNDSGTDSGNDGSILPIISADGTRVAFSSRASDLVRNDTNGLLDAFVSPVIAPATVIADIMSDVVGLNLDKGFSNSLVAKLGAAGKTLADANANNDVAAIGSLKAFIASVEAQRGKKLADADADALVLATEEIIDMLATQ